jgi:hypothetical protein
MLYLIHCENFSICHNVPSPIQQLKIHINQVHYPWCKYSIRWTSDKDFLPFCKLSLYHWLVFFLHRKFDTIAFDNNLFYFLIERRLWNQLRCPTVNEWTRKM